MSIAVFLKNNLKNIPPSVGVLINKLTYDYRPGISSIYRKRKKEIVQFNLASSLEKESFIFDRMKFIVLYAYENIKFYKEYYDQCKFDPKVLKSFSDLKLIPITSKEILRKYEITERSKPINGSYKVNTGGTSGTPFSLLVLPDSMGHEWAHMHTIWSQLGYKQSDLKIVFGGRSDVNDIVEYDVVRNHFAVDIYAKYEDVSKKLKKILKNHPIKYLHGYPSSIYEFALYCENQDNTLKQLLRKNLKGAFLGSEFPHKKYREVIENVFEIESVSWYGHTERAVLAYEENDKFLYKPFQTYGYTEAIVSNNNYNLVSTNFYNFASPLIRYNTEDSVSDVKYDGNILQSFKILDGREGEFIFDEDGNKISLTGFIFGRHHKLFDFSKFIQVKQLSKGEAIIYFVSNSINEDQAPQYFDSSNIALLLSFVKLEEPIRTVSGKINLLIK